MYSLFAPLFPSRPRLRSLLLLTTLLASVSIGSDVKATQGRAPGHGVPLLQRAQTASVDTAVTSGTAVPPDIAGGTINAAANPAVADRSTLVFLPIIASGRIGSGSINKPLPPDAYDDDGADPPLVAEDPNATECASFIDFTNFSNETVYVFWVGPGDEEMLYKVLESGRHYWQHTYRYNEWRVRDDAGRLVLAFTQQDCEESAHNIFIDDLPPCGGILQIGLWDRVREVPLNGYGALTDGMTIDLGLLPPAIIHIDAQDAVESVEVLGGGAVVALNELPYNYPPNNAAWQPAAGELSLIFNAYRKDNAVGTICDSRELSLTILYSTATPSPTVTPTTDGGPTATVTPTPSATSDGSVTATPSATPSLTQPPTPSTPTPSTPTPSTTPASCGRIEAIRFYDLDADAPIARYAPLQNGAIVDLDKLPPRFNIDVLLSGAAESLRFALNGDQSLENRAPYRYPGADVNPWQPAVGGYTLVATAYEFDEAAGAVCDQQIINFAVVDGAATATPTPSSTGTPTATPTPTPTTVVPATPTPTPTVTSTVTLTPTATPIPSGATCLGDRAWIDSNENGRQDPGEVGLGAIDIYLWADDNVDGLRDRIITATTTNSAGSYALCGLDPTLTYIVEFGTLPQCRFTLADQGTDEALDSDAIPVSGLTTPIQLATGENNVTVDAGFVCGEF